MPPFKDAQFDALPVATSRAPFLRVSAGEIVALGYSTILDLCSLGRQTDFEEDSAVREARPSLETPWKPQASLLLTDSAALAANAESFGLQTAQIRLATCDVLNAIMQRREPWYRSVSGVRGREHKFEFASTATKSQAVAIFKRPQPCNDFRQPRWEWQRWPIGFIGQIGRQQMQ